MYERPVLHKKCTVTTFARDLLGTAEVDIHSVDGVLDSLRASKQCHRIVRAELCYKRPVYSAPLFAMREIILGVLGALFLFRLYEYLENSW